MSCERYKGHDSVLSAWPWIREAIPDAELVILGTGDDEVRLRARVDSERIMGVRFLGRVDDAERDRHYRSCRLLLQPSTREGFGLAAVEAAAAGVPVLALRGTVIEELFPGGDGVRLIPHQNPREIASAAVAILSKEELAQKLGHQARAQVESNLLEEHFVDRFVSAVADLVQ
jgi:glycosyltransferase involved in cell wall biosynthesis